MVAPKEAMNSREELIMPVNEQRGQMPAPFFTVVVPTYNQAQYLPAALDSLLAQTFSNWEAVVVNDGSTDETAQVLESYSALDQRFRVLHQNNGGVAAALNSGLRHARGEWICWLSSDDLFEADKLQVHLDAIGRYPETRFFYSHFYYLDDASGIISEPDLWQPVPEPHFQVSRFLLAPYVHGNSIAFHRVIIQTVGYFKEYLRSGQDFDMWLRISAAHPSKYIDSRTCVTRWHVNQSTNAFPEAGFYDSTRSAIEFINNNPFPALFPLLNLSDPKQALMAVEESISISTNPSALIHKCGPTTALLDRLYEWLSRDCPEPVRLQISDAIQCSCTRLSELQVLPATIRNGISRILASSPYRYEQHNFFAEIELFVQTLEQEGDIDRASSLRKYYEQCTHGKGSIVSHTGPNSELQGETGESDRLTGNSGSGWIGNTVCKRILIVSDHYWPSIGGTELFVEEIANRLVNEGCRVHVATGWRLDRTETDHNNIGIFQLRCGGNLNVGGPTGEIEEYRRLVTEGNYDVVLVLGHPDLWIGLGIVNLPQPRPRIIFMPSINAENILNWHNSGLFANVAEILRSADTLVSVTESGYDAKFMDANGLGHHFIPHAVEQKAAPKNFRSEYGIPNEIPLLVMVANFWPVKNHPGLLQSISGTPGAWKLVLIGHPIDSQKDYFNQVKLLAGQDQRISIIEGLSPDRAAAAIRDADLLLVPSKGESAGPLVILQAMSFGTPWIATPECNAVRDEAGGVVAPLDQFPLVIEKLLARPEARERLGRLGRDHWRTSFTWEKVWPAFRNLIDNRAAATNLTMPEAIRRQNELIVKELLPLIKAEASSSGAGETTKAKFAESALAHRYCTGRGLEIGGSAHNPFGLDTRNVDACGSMNTYFKDEERSNCGEAMPVDIVAAGDDIPLPDASQDFIVSSHVLEHFPNPVKALLEWDRLVKPGGIIFMIVPHRDRTFEKDRPRTSLDHVIEDFHRDAPADSEWPHQHYHCWITEDVVQLVGWMQQNLGVTWQVLEVQDVDDKVGNGFTVVIRKTGSRSCPEVTSFPVKTRPLVSVVVPTCNRAVILKQFLAALERQTYPKELYEVILVDDGSTDETEQVVRSFSPSFRLEFFKQPNSGPAAARNRGIEKVSGDLILILNDDAIASPDLIERHVAAHAEAGDEKTIILGSFPFAEEYLTTPLMQLFQQSDILFQFVRMVAHQRYDFRHFWTCNVSLPKVAFSQAGLFDEDFREPAGEDTEMGYRLWKAGYSILYLPECRTEHAHRIPLLNYSRRQVSVGRNNILVALKHPEIAEMVTGLQSIDSAESKIGSWLRANTEMAINAFNAIRSVDIEMNKTHAIELAGKIQTVIPLVNQFWLYQGFMNGINEFCGQKSANAKRLRITFLSPGTAISGGVKIIFEYCNRLAAKGHEINLVILHGERPSWFSFHPGVNYIEASWDEDLLLKVLPDADAIFATFWASSYVVARLPASKGKRFYLVQDYESHTIATPEQVDPSYLLPLHKIVVSSWLGETLARLFGQRSVVVTNALDHGIFYPENDLRKRFQANDFRVGMLWHHEERKGLSTGLAAFRLIQERIPNAKLVLMGVNRPDHVQFDEFHENIYGEDVRRYYCSLDVFVSNSIQEGFGLPGLEAMSCGIPLVTTDSGGVRDYAIQGESAILVQPGNPEAMADAVIRLAQNGTLRERLSSNGLNIAKRFTWDNSVNILESAICEKLKFAEGNYPEAIDVELLPETVSQKKIKIAVFSLDSRKHACGYYRILSPARSLADSIELKWGITDDLSGTLITNEELAGVDLIIIQRFFPRPETKEFTDFLLSLGKPVIYEADDLLTEIPENNPSHEWGMLSAPHIRDVAMKCSAVTVSTDDLKAYFKAYNNNVNVLPNLLDGILWNKSCPQSQGPIIIGFAGTVTHTADLALVEDVLERVAAKYGDRIAFTFMGCATERMSRLPGFSFVPFENTYEAYARRLQEIPFDIMLVPLEDTPFNRSKSNIKWLEYSACGIAGIYSDLPPYNTSVDHGKTGLLVAHHPDKWFQAVELLIEHPEIRKNIAQQARMQVLSQHTLQQNAHRFLSLYERVIGEWRAGHASSGASTSSRKAHASIIVPLFNQLSFTKQCIKALASSISDSVQYELILVDNGSTDGTGEYLSCLDTREGIRTISNKSNLGFAKACNQGATYATGEYLIFLNNDTIPQPGWLEALLDDAKAHGADICGAKLLYPDGRVQHAGVAFDESGIGYHIFKNLPSDAIAVNNKRFMQCVTGACMLVAKELFQQLGGFDEMFMNGFEDVDLCLRAGTLGRKILYTPDSVVIHFEETSEGRKTYDSSNMHLFMSRWKGKVLCDDELFYKKEGYVKVRNENGSIMICHLPAHKTSDSRTAA